MPAATAFCASVAAAVCFSRGTEIAQPLLLIDEDGRHLPDAGHVQRFGDVAFRGRAVAEHADGGALLAAQPKSQRHADGMRRVRADRHAIGKVLARAGEIVAALVAAPIQEQFLQGDAAPKLRAVLAKARHKDIARLHGGSDADRDRLLAE